MDEIRALSPTGGLGDTPIEKDSFYSGLKRDPHFLGADAGSGDIGPVWLGTDGIHNPREWEKFDLDLLLTASRERNIPMMIGSAGSTGTNKGVNRFVEIIKEIAREKKLRKFKLAAIFAELDKDYVKERLSKEEIEGLGASDLTMEDIDMSDHIVAMMGIEPYIKAMEMGADVIIAGRSCDDAIYAALPIMKGFPKGLSFHMGKALECASLVGTPQMIHESMLGTIREDSILIEPMHPDQITTPASVAAHSMYERVDPYIQGIPGGILDMHAAKYEQYSERTTKITGSRFVEEKIYRVKIEGAGKVGHRAFFIIGIRDPIAISQIDRILKDARKKVRNEFNELAEGLDYNLSIHVYGKNGVMGNLETEKKITSHELGIVIEAVAKTEELAESIVKFAKFRGFFYSQYPGQKNSSGGGAALIVDEVLKPGQMACRWTINHLLTVDDPLELFPIKMMEIGY